jgi:hypothetical protein
MGNDTLFLSQSVFWYPVFGPPRCALHLTARDVNHILEDFTLGKKILIDSQMRCQLFQFITFGYHFFPVRSPDNNTIYLMAIQCLTNTVNGQHIV